MLKRPGRLKRIVKKAVVGGAIVASSLGSVAHGEQKFREAESFVRRAIRDPDFDKTYLALNSKDIETQKRAINSLYERVSKGEDISAYVPVLKRIASEEFYSIKGGGSSSPQEDALHILLKLYSRNNRYEEIVLLLASPNDLVRSDVIDFLSKAPKSQRELFFNPVRNSILFDRSPGVRSDATYFFLMNNWNTTPQERERLYGILADLLPTSRGKEVATRWEENLDYLEYHGFASGAKKQLLRVLPKIKDKSVKSKVIKLIEKYSKLGY